MMENNYGSGAPVSESDLSSNVPKTDYSRGVYWSSIVTSFLMICLISAILFMPSYLEDLENLQPTERKIVHDNGRIEYVVSSNWDNAKCKDIGNRTMGLFTKFGSFIGGFGGAVNKVLGLFPDWMNDTVRLNESDIQTLVDLGYTSHFSTERDFWRFYNCLTERNSRLDFVVQVIRYNSNSDTRLYFLPVTTITEFSKNRSKYYRNRPIDEISAWWSDLQSDWTNFKVVSTDGSIRMNRVFVLSNEQYTSLKSSSGGK